MLSFIFNFSRSHYWGWMFLLYVQELEKRVIAEWHSPWKHNFIKQIFPYSCLSYSENTKFYTSTAEKRQGCLFFFILSYLLTCLHLGVCWGLSESSTRDLMQGAECWGTFKSTTVVGVLEKGGLAKSLLRCRVIRFTERMQKASWERKFLIKTSPNTFTMSLQWMTVWQEWHKTYYFLQRSSKSDGKTESYVGGKCRNLIPVEEMQGTH